MIHRRDFLARTAGTLGALALTPADAFAAPANAARSETGRVHAALAARGVPSAPAALADDEEFWAEVRRAFDLAPDVINLDNGWTNPAPRAAVDELVERARSLQALPAERLAGFWEETTNVEVRQALAEVLGVPGSEIALVRNATEALDTVLLGVPLSPGDEVVCSAHDYYAMLDALDQRQARDRVVLRMVHPPVPAPSLDALAETYEAAIGARTRLVLLTHPSNLTGQLLPVQRIAAAAHAVGAEVVIDGAQSLGLFQEPISSLGCDYYGASCHKWLGGPVGLGVLWMRKEHTVKVWPLIPSPRRLTDIGRFEWIGTGPEYVGPAMLPALEVHQALGPARKAARLRYLNAYLRERVASVLPEARFYTLPEEAMSCGLFTVELPGKDSSDLQRRLRERGILVQAMSGDRAPEIRCLRVSPNVYTSIRELDQFVTALADLAR